jgi:hypothetical protein
MNARADPTAVTLKVEDTEFRCPVNVLGGTTDRATQSRWTMPMRTAWRTAWVRSRASSFW